MTFLSPHGMHVVSCHLLFFVDHIHAINEVEKIWQVDKGSLLCIRAKIGELWDKGPLGLQNTEGCKKNLKHFSRTSFGSTMKYGSFRGLANGTCSWNFMNFGTGHGGPAIPFSNMHQSFTDALVYVFLYATR